MSLVPNLFIVGAPKCGTTALHHYLSVHPQVFMSQVKEPHHFSVTQPPSAYRDAERYCALFTQGVDHRIRGDASSSYLFDEHAAERIRDVSPEARVIALVRDPIQRAYSHFLMDLRDGRQRLPLMQALCKDERTGPTVWGGPSRLYVEFGHYGEQIQRYVDVFGRDRVLVLESTSLLRERMTALTATLDFLGLAPYEMTPKQRKVLMSLHNVNAVPTNSWSRYWGARTHLRERVTELTPRPLRPIARTAMMRRKPAAHPPLCEEAHAWLEQRLQPHVLHTEAVVQRSLPSLHASLRA